MNSCDKIDRGGDKITGIKNVDNKYGILIICTAILVLGFVGTASAVTWYVDADGGADFTGIQEAITAASAGDTIVVRDDTYTVAKNVEAMAGRFRLRKREKNLKWQQKK